jgi:tetratricopeptide (TPR) repeat protein
MKRRVTVIVVTALLLGGAIVAEKALQSVEREDPMGRKLLYLPSAEMLRLASFGNAGLIADALYLWSIQYYGQYGQHERFLYLDSVYQLITDLDPLYFDAYRVGALIMQLSTIDEEENKQSVIRLFDKALRNMPANHEIAEAAGWDLFIRYRDRKEGIRYFEAAVDLPGAPIRIRRFLAAWREKEEAWSIEDAIAYWIEVRDSTEDAYNRAVSERQIYRLVASRDVEQLDPILKNWSLMHGRCPDSWAAVVETGFLTETPTDYFGRPYRILPEGCVAMGEDEVRFFD